MRTSTRNCCSMPGRWTLMATRVRRGRRHDCAMDAVASGRDPWMRDAARAGPVLQPASADDKSVGTGATRSRRSSSAVAYPGGSRSGCDRQHLSEFHEAAAEILYQDSEAQRPRHRRLRKNRGGSVPSENLCDVPMQMPTDANALGACTAWGAEGIDGTRSGVIGCADTALCLGTVTLS